MTPKERRQRQRRLKTMNFSLDKIGLKEVHGTTQQYGTLIFFSYTLIILVKNNAITT